MKIRRKHVYWTLFVLHFFIVHWIIIYIVRTRLPLGNTIHFVDTSVKDVQGVLTELDPAWALAARKALGPAEPFQEVSPFDEDAMSWSQMFAQFGTEGVLVFDANGDGRQDVFFCQDGQNWTRPTGKDDVLVESARHTHNVLYLNQGNDAEGKPRYRQVADLARNDTHSRAELLIEGFLKPRNKASDPDTGKGRSSYTAIAADFDGNGHLDLFVANAPPGMFWSHPETQRILPQFVEPIGREARGSKQPLQAMGQHLISYEPRSSLEDRRESSRGDEAEGANSLFLNLGDEDGDGLPEWRDASRELGIEGIRPTMAVSAFDFDLDGDLDIFCANTMDHDYWPGGSTKWAGGANCLYQNQLAETGELGFVEKAAELDVDGVYDRENPMPPYFRLRRIPYLAIEYSFMLLKMEPFIPELLSIAGKKAEPAQISWGTVVQDVDEDGYPDLWVANDLGYLRLYRNQGGKGFVDSPHARSQRSGFWMTFAPADFDGDLHEDLFVGNLGGATMNNATVPYVPLDLFDPVFVSGVLGGQFLADKHDSTHVILDGKDITRELAPKVAHSRTLPPDVSLPNNYRREAYGRSIPVDRFDVDSLDPYEMAWGATTLDIRNRGSLSLYWVGGLYGRAGGIFSLLGSSPGRLLTVVSKRSDPLRFLDETAEQQVFNIEGLHYEDQPKEQKIWRRAPSQNWGKRDIVTSRDRSVWTSQGPTITERVTNQDMLQTAENGRAALAVDLNGDGATDLIVRNKGGYDSRSPDAGNLAIRIDGHKAALPPPDANYPTPTSYQPGATRVFLNRHRNGHWLGVRLLDDSVGALNRDGIGARVVLDGMQLRIRRAGTGSFASNEFVPLHFGLGDRIPQELLVTWPDRQRTETRVQLSGVIDTQIVISKTQGLVR